MPRFIGKDGYKHHWEPFRQNTRAPQPNCWDEDERYFRIALVVVRYSDRVKEKVRNSHIEHKGSHAFILAFGSRRAFYDDDSGLKVIEKIIDDLNYHQRIHNVTKRILESICHP